MYNPQHKQNRILNNNLLLFAVFCLCGVLYLSIVVSYGYFLFLTLLPLTIRKVRINKFQIIIYCSIVVVFSILIVFANQFSLIDLVNQGFKKIHLDVIKNSMIKFGDKHYDAETASFIKLILFNIKDKNSWVFYQQTVDLGIVWLIGISGFHISLISKIIRGIFKKRPRIGKYVNISIISFYSFLLNFSYASLRILFKLCFDSFFRKFNIERYDKLGWIGLIICLTNPVCFSKYGFLLSFIVCIVAYFINGFELNNKLINSVLINVFSFLVTIPFVISMNHKISILTFINAFVFTYFSSFIFLYFSVFSGMPFMAIIHRWIIVASYVLIGNISLSNVYIKSDDGPVWANGLYYFVFSWLSKGVYLIVYNNKI